MGVSTITMCDYPSVVAPARWFQAYCADNHNFIPKACPTFVQSVDIIEGDKSGSAPCVKLIKFPEGRPFKYIINRVEELDASKFYFKYTTIEGGVLRDREFIDHAVYEMKFKPTGDGCHFTMVGQYHTKGDYVVKEEDVADGKASIKKMFYTAEDYLTSNPELYA